MHAHVKIQFSHVLPIQFTHFNLVRMKFTHIVEIQFVFGRTGPEAVSEPRLHLFQKDLPEGFVPIFFHHFKHLFYESRFKHHVVTNTRQFVDAREIGMKPEHMVEIMAVVFSPEIVLALVFGIDEMGWCQEKSVGVNDQVAVQDSRYDNSCIQLDELLQIPAVSLIFAMVNRDLVKKGENGFVDHDAIGTKKVQDGGHYVNVS